MKHLVVAKVFVVNDRRELLVLKRSEYEGRPDLSHQPDIPGGLTNPKEHERTAAARELREETGLSVDDMALEFCYASTRYVEKTDESLVKLLYVARFDHTPEVTLSWEHESYEWVPVEEVVKRFSLSPSNADGLEYALEHELI